MGFPYFCIHVNSRTKLIGNDRKRDMDFIEIQRGKSRRFPGFGG